MRTRTKKSNRPEHMTENLSRFAASVVIPTHNPREDYLRRVLEALRRQTLVKDLWELVVVDNGSREPLKAAVGPRDYGTKGPQATEVDLSWHANARIVREEGLGLTNARLRGFAETSGEVIVLVDDDNVLAPDYLEQVMGIAREYPFLGTWSGALELELEPGSPAPAKELRHLLCERKPTKEVWSNDRSNFAATPWGAGECIRRAVAEAYATKVAGDPRRAGRTRAEVGHAIDEEPGPRKAARAQHVVAGEMESVKRVHTVEKDRLHGRRRGDEHVARKGGVFRTAVHPQGGPGRTAGDPDMVVRKCQSGSIGGIHHHHSPGGGGRGFEAVTIDGDL